MMVRTGGQPVINTRGGSYMDLGYLFSLFGFQGRNAASSLYSLSARATLAILLAFVSLHWFSSLTDTISLALMNFYLGAAPPNALAGKLARTANRASRAQRNPQSHSRRR
eukprot:GHVU01057586.1.p1 GENE.GHVU01057586.1~~GHVU01057586.1.p1  ORF type:complete len:110 (-),score=0.45 GHVU01057586.1:116-445(-)